MREKYNHAKIERKWQRRWNEEKLFAAPGAAGPDKRYVLDMFPYPSAQGLHVGHPEGYTASDIVSRYFRMKGFPVLHPMGFDSFGLPAENYAIKTGTHPAVTTAKNIRNMRKQIKSLGFSYDWDREVITSDPSYYQWTQWIFLQLFKHGLAYESYAPINWCPSCKTGLANEEVVAGTCERCGTEVTKKSIKQWLVKITDERYIERLLHGLDKLDWPENIKLLQKNWIGRSEGAEVDFSVAPHPRVLAATTNPSKVVRFKKLLASIGTAPDLVTPADEHIKTIEVHEDGNLRENAEAKARAYFGKTKLPVLAVDTGLYIDGETHDPAMVRRTALGGKDESQLSRKQIMEHIIRHYSSVAKKHGGKVNAYWIDCFALVTPDGTVRFAEARRDIILTDTLHKPVDPHFPMRSLYINVATNKRPVDETEHEEVNIELKPVKDALSKLLCPVIRVFTTRPDTLFGATYMVLSPEHELVGSITTPDQKQAVEKYQTSAAKKSDLDRTDLAKEKTGVFTGAYAINPVNGAKIPIWIADYVLRSYGTGAIMAVPAHDERDAFFAEKYHLKFRHVILPKTYSQTQHYWEIFAHDAEITTQEAFRYDYQQICEGKEVPFAYTGEGTMINSGKYDGMDSVEFKKVITAWLQRQGKGKTAVNYKLRDWVFSRQRYWGEPIPIVHCEKCGHVAVPEKHLPVKLPNVKKYKPTGTGESPLAAIATWVNVKCPQCGGPAKRETNTMPQWAGSNWYWLRYCDPHNDKKLADPEKLKQWLPVDLYIGGAEHAVLHLLYARFIYKFLCDIEVIPKEFVKKNGDEPFIKLKNQGLILGEDGQKMSKSRGNVVNPDDVIKKFGADAMRMYEMFMGPFEDVKPWNTKGLIGMTRFLDRVWEWSLFLIEWYKDNPQAKNLHHGIVRQLHITIKKISEDIENFKFNTAIAQLMTYIKKVIVVNGQSYEGQSLLKREEFEIFLKLMSPFAPHIAEELWERLGHQKSIMYEQWPLYDEAKVQDEQVKFVVQVNGKVRDIVIARPDATVDQVRALALKSPKVRKYVATEPKKVVFVPGRLINFVV
ncbi:MAG: leucine--tRNA ligase [Patescibacteria group bacterium]|nr:leucine--tRNA ligase [Patescibacteria group bacterium]MDD5715495.1 leucine--tRNA ligase [Patescibacteria group bacterium]